VTPELTTSTGTQSWRSTKEETRSNGCRPPSGGCRQASPFERL